MKYLPPGKAMSVDLVESVREQLEKNSEGCHSLAHSYYIFWDSHEIDMACLYSVPAEPDTLVVHPTGLVWGACGKL